MKLNDFSKRSQTWGLDVIIAVYLFSIGIVVFLIYSMNYSAEAVNALDKLHYDGDSIMRSLLSDGSPADWNESNVVTIGITTNNKINITKLERFYTLTQTNYNKTKLIFNTKYNYYFFLDKKIHLNSIDIDGIGNPQTNLSTIQSTNLIKLTRFSIYNEEPTTIYLYVWE